MRPIPNIVYTFHCSPWGQIVLAQSTQGICALLLGEDTKTLEKNLQRRFPHQELIYSVKQMQPALREVAHFIKYPTTEFQLPLDLQGTIFQKQVWEALLRIPFASTSSYTEIARRIQMPKASRAVAQACGANPVSIIVPCHRVLRKDGSLSGYSWGIERKEKLLDFEKEYSMARG
jgi:O-6-methylguanine DNA methyltransferase